MFRQEQLRDSPVFSRLSATDLALLFSRMENRTVQSNQLVCQQGERDSYLRILLDGELERFIESPGTDRIFLGRISAGSIFGLERFNEHEPRRTSIEATKNSTICEISVRAFRELFEQMPRAISTLLDAVTRAESNGIEQIEQQLGINPDNHKRATSRAVPPSRQKRGTELESVAVGVEHYPETSEMLSVSLLAELKQVGKCVSYPIGTSFFDDGDTPENCAVILSGKIRVTGPNEQEPLQVTTETAGAILGISALYPQDTGESTAYTVSEVHVIEFSRADFDTLLKEPTVHTCRLQELVLRRLLAQQGATLQNIIELESQRPRSSETVPLKQSDIEKGITKLASQKRPRTAETLEAIPTSLASKPPVENKESQAQTISIPADAPNDVEK